MPFCIAHVAAAVVIALPALAASQTIQRCEGPGGRITYSNADCPEGTRPVKALQPAPAPSLEAQRTAQDNAARDAQAVQQMAEQRRSQQAAAAQVQQQQQRDQRGADCAFLQGEIQSVHRMRNLMVNRPYYSLDDLEQMDRHAEQLTTDYRRVCG
jgi:hypothetical protein